jgi:hypothetical protein
MLVALWAVSIMLVWSILVIGWLSTEDQFTQIGNRVVGDVRALSEARDLEAQILGFKRNDLLWQTTGQVDVYNRFKLIKGHLLCYSTSFVR